MVKEEITKLLRKALKDLGIKAEDKEIEIAKPQSEQFGDYSTNFAMKIFIRVSKGGREVSKVSKVSEVSKVSKGEAGELEKVDEVEKVEKVEDGKKVKSPMDLAEKIVLFLNSQLSTLNSIDHIEAVKPGFINFWLSKDYLVNQLEEALKEEEKFGRGISLWGKKIMVEFTDPNPFKEFHIGHLYTNIVGESLARIQEALGATVKRANYQGDVGMHVAKSIWGMRQKMQGEKINLEELESKPLKERIKFLGQSYALGSSSFEKSEEIKEEIKKLNKIVYELSDPKINELYQKGRQWSLDYFETIYGRLGTRFDYYFFEREVGEKGKEIVKEYLGKGVFKKSDGAVVFEGEKYGFHTRVFLNSLGLPTYEAKDLALPSMKYEKFHYDLSIIITGNEIKDYFRVVMKALEFIDPVLQAKTTHIGHGMVRLPEGKISSRKGGVLTGEWLLDQVKNKLTTNYKEMEKEVLDMVVVASVKYAFLKSSIGKDIVFNLDESISLEGNSGPYLQYTYARTQSILAKYQISNIKYPMPDLKFEVGNLKLEIEEVNLLRMIYFFPEVVEESASNLAPNLIANYLFDLAQKFNLFYQKHKVIGNEKEEFRVALVAAVGQVLKNGLHLLGIKSPERM